MADTTNATYDGGIDVPLEDFSDTKFGINSVTSKLFAINFYFYSKTKRRRVKFPRLFRIELLQ